jgi:hypothetical protein
VQQISAAGVPGSALATPAPYDLSSTGYGYGPYAFLYSGVGCLQSGSCVGVGEYDSSAHGFQPYLLDEQAPLTIATTSLTAGTQGAAYQATLAAAGAWGNYSWSVSAGSLPAGLSLNAQTGVISGTPTTSGTASFTVQVTGSGAAPQTTGEPLSLVVAAAPATTTTPAGAGTTAVARPMLRLLAASTKVKSGRLAVGLACSGAACQGSLRIETSELLVVRHGNRRVREHRTLVIGTARYTAPAGSARTVEVTLARAGRTALTKARGERLVVQIRATLSGGRDVSRRETIRSTARMAAR